MDDVAAATPDTAPADEGWEWMFVEIMGHRSHWGRTRQESWLGAMFLRVDVPIDGNPAKGWASFRYGAPAIFSASLTDEATVMRKNMPWEAQARLKYHPSEIEAAGVHDVDSQDGPDDDDIENVF